MSDKALIDQLKALAHPLRYAILEELDARERNVSEIEQATGIGQPTLSQQLAVLRKSGLVETRRAAKLVSYRIVPEQIARLAPALDRPEEHTSALQSLMRNSSAVSCLKK